MALTDPLVTHIAASLVGLAVGYVGGVLWRRWRRARRSGSQMLHDARNFE